MSQIKTCYPAFAGTSETNVFLCCAFATMWTFSSSNPDIMFLTLIVEKAQKKPKYMKPCLPCASINSGVCLRCDFSVLLCMKETKTHSVSQQGTEGAGDLVDVQQLQRDSDLPFELRGELV